MRKERSKVHVAVRESYEKKGSDTHHYIIIWSSPLLTNVSKSKITTRTLRASDPQNPIGKSAEGLGYRDFPKSITSRTAHIPIRYLPEGEDDYNVPHNSPYLHNTILHPE
jgi:hypothetical protein